MRLLHVERTGMLILLAFSLLITLQVQDTPTGQVIHDQYRWYSQDQGRTSTNQRSLHVQDTIIYKYARYSVNETSWQRITLNGISIQGTDWIQGTATYTLPTNMTGPGLHYLITYTCTNKTPGWNSWNCHGNQTEDERGSWQLKIINNTPEPAAETAVVVTARGRSAAGEAANMVIEAADMNAMDLDVPETSTDYAFTVPTTTTSITLRFTNDYYQEDLKLDRNLYIERMTVNGAPIDLHGCTYSQHIYAEEGTIYLLTGGSAQCSLTGGCVPNCDNKQCGSDGCGGSCGTCTEGTTYAVIGDSMSNNYSSDWLQPFAERIGIGPEDIPTYAVSGNSCDQVYAQLPQVADGTTNLFSSCGINAFDYRDNTLHYQDIYEEAKRKGVSRVFMTTMPPYDQFNSRAQTQAVTACDKMKAENAWLKNYASQHEDLVVVDLWTLWHDTSGTKTTDCGWRAGLSSDGVHPNSGAYQAWGEAYYQAFTNQEPAIPVTAQPISIVSVTATSDDGHVPENTLDNDLSDESRWSAEGDGEYIQYAFNATTLLDEVAIAFYRGTTRQTLFTISTSTDGSTWTTAYDGASSGTTSLQQPFTFAERAARHVRITGNGNTEENNDWNSIIEVSFRYRGEDLLEKAGTVTPPEPPVQSGECGDAVIVYENNFEQHTTPGKYGAISTVDEFRAEWNNNHQEKYLLRWTEAEIVQDAEKGKALKITYPFYDNPPVGRYDAASDSYDETLGDGISASDGGGRWVVNLPPGPVYGGYYELYLSFDVKFGPGFNGAEGGKMHGLCGGSCPGGGAEVDIDKDGSSDGFSARTMFYYDHLNGYIYHPAKVTWGTTQLLEGVQPEDDGWHTITYRIVMNSGTNANGIIEVWYDGIRVSHKSDYRFRNGSNSDFAIDTFLFSTFYGGGTQDACRSWMPSCINPSTGSIYAYSSNTQFGNKYVYYFAPRKDEVIYYDNFVVYYYDPSSSVTQGNRLSDAGRIEIPPPAGNPEQPGCP